MGNAFDNPAKHKLMYPALALTQNRGIGAELNIVLIYTRIADIPEGLEYNIADNNSQQLW